MVSARKRSNANNGIMRVKVCLGPILIPEYLDLHSGYSAPWRRIAGRAIARNPEA